MRPDPDEVRRLLDELREGDRESGRAVEAKLMQMLAPWVRTVIRKTLDNRVRRWADSDDILQNLAVAFMNIVAQKRGCDGRQFLQYVAEAVKHLTLNANRHYLQSARGRADAKREDLNEDNEPSSSADDPAKHVEAKDTLDQMLNHANENARTVLAMRLEGHKTREIAAAAKLNPRTVRKIVEAWHRDHETSEMG